MTPGLPVVDFLNLPLLDFGSKPGIAYFSNPHYEVDGSLLSSVNNLEKMISPRGGTLMKTMTGCCYIEEVKVSQPSKVATRNIAGDLPLLEATHGFQAWGMSA